jgi:inositol transport system permease protein
MPNDASTQPSQADARRRWLSRYGLAIALLFVGTVLTLTSPQFLTVPNLINVLRQISINGILAIGVTFVLLSGGVDLSLGSVLALAGVLAASCAQPGEHLWFVPVAVGIGAGALCGALNGSVIAVARVPSFIVTLGMMTLARGLALVASGGKPVSSLSAEFRFLGGGDVGGVPVPVVLLVGAALLAHLFLRHLRLGRHLYAVGGNELAAHASGIRVAAVKWFAYLICGATAGLAGVVLAARVTTGQPNAGLGYELDAIAAVVIGGTSLSGGVGGVGGTLLGALLMGVINNGLDLLNVSSYYQQIVKGLIIIAAVWLDRRARA